MKWCVRLKFVPIELVGTHKTLLSQANHHQTTLFVAYPEDSSEHASLREKELAKTGHFHILI